MGNVVVVVVDGGGIVVEMNSDTHTHTHNSFNQLDLPEYESFEQLTNALKLAIKVCFPPFFFSFLVCLFVYFEEKVIEKFLI